MAPHRFSWPLSTPRGTVLLLVLGTLALGVHGVIEWFDHQHRLAGTPGFAPLLVLRLAASSCVVAALALAWRKRERFASGTTGPVGFALRGLACGLLVAWTLGSAAHLWLAADKTVTASAFWSGLIAFASLWTGYVLLFPEQVFAARPRWLETVVFNLLAMLLAAEAIVSLWAWANPSPYLWDESSVAASIEAQRLPPRTLRLGTFTNSQGYYDEEFHPSRGEEDLVVAVLADSFGVGVVSHAEGFATVAERRLRELLPGRTVSLHNFGVPGIGMPEYAWLLQYEVPEVAPQIVLLCVFVGNDFQSVPRNRGSYYSFHRFVVYELGRRLLGTRGTVVEGGMLDTEHLASADAPESPAPGDELPTFTPERFLEIERDRMEITRVDDEKVEKMVPRFLRALDSIQRAAGSSLRVVLIPDEFQVDDGLWQDLIRPQAEGGNRFERERPQRRVLDHCREHGIACLDLLPVLRRAHAAAPTYHLRDTHWNAHGNRVAGEAIARFLAHGSSAGFVAPGPDE